MRALVLSGGGSKGAFQVGVLKRWMGEQGRDYDIICGVSVGALNAAGLAMTPKGMPAAASAMLEKFWLDHVTGTSSIYRRWCPFGRLHALWEKSVYDSTPLIELVRSTIDMSLVKASNRLIRVGAVCLDDGEYRYGAQDDPDFVNWVLASSSYPVFLKPIEIGGKLWSDGGIKQVTPIGEAIRLGAEEIDVVMCDNPFLVSSWNSRSKQAIPDQLIRTLDLMNTQIVRNDIETTGLKNQLADIEPRYRHVKVRFVMPEQRLNENALEFDPAMVRKLIDLGYDCADRYVVYD